MKRYEKEPDEEAARNEWDEAVEELPDADSLETGGRKERGKREQEDGEQSILREALGFLIYAAVIFGCTFFIIMFVAQRTSVSGDSMNDTLQSGDQLITEKLIYRFREPERFDIVVFRHTHEEFYIKRLIGLPGETVQIIGDDIYIDGELLEENYGREPMQDAKLAAEPITLGEDEYFVLGDNRNYSSDSRDPSVANVKREQIIGRAWLRIWPLNKIGFISHR